MLDLWKTNKQTTDNTLAYCDHVQMIWRWTQSMSVLGGARKNLWSTLWFQAPFWVPPFSGPREWFWLLPISSRGRSVTPDDTKIPFFTCSFLRSRFPGFPWYEEEDGFSLCPLIAVLSKTGYYKSFLSVRSVLWFLTSPPKPKFHTWSSPKPLLLLLRWLLGIVC